MIIYIDPTTSPTKIMSFDRDGHALKQAFVSNGQAQTDEILQIVDELIAHDRKNVTGLAVNISPASYTSSRVAITIINFLGLGLDIQPQGVGSESEIFFSKSSGFSQPVFPRYKSGPVITKKDRH